MELGVLNPWGASEAFSEFLLWRGSKEGVQIREKGAKKPGGSI